MIRVSTRGRYALRAMLDLALHAEEGSVSRQAIANRQGLSTSYVAQLFLELATAGLAEGVKGPGGGYRLARDAATIRVGEVIQAVEGPIALVHCVLPEDDAPCRRVDCCATHYLWRRLSDVVADFLDSITLKDLCDDAMSLQLPSL